MALMDWGEDVMRSRMVDSCFVSGKCVMRATASSADSWRSGFVVLVWGDASLVLWVVVDVCTV